MNTNAPTFDAERRGKASRMSRVSKRTSSNNQQSNNMKSLLITLTAVLVTALSARADVTVKKAFTMPAVGTVNVEETDCENSGGPWITLDGSIALGGLQLQLILQNNEKGTHTATVTTTNVVLLDIGDEITIPKQPVRGGAGGNPHIYIQFTDGQGNAVGDELYLGRCVQGLTLEPAFLLNALASADISVGDCSNSGGPWITIGGGIRLSGIAANIIFRNNLKGTHTAEVSSTVSLLQDGSTIKIPKQPVRGGAGGNPIISVQFLDGAGNPIGEPIKLGKCNRI
jgi:hypothetical protein